MSVLSQYLRVADGSVLQNFETIGDWTSYAGGFAADTTNFRTGTKAIRLTTASGSSEYITAAINATITLPVRVSFYVADVTAVDSVAVYLANDAGYSRSYCSTSLGDSYGGLGAGANLRTGWNTVTLAAAEFSGSGGSSWLSPMLSLRLRVNAAAGRVAVVSFDEISHGAIRQPAVVFTFDDSTVETHTVAYPLMEPYGVRGTSYQITSLIGAGGRMTLGQLQDLEGSGWDIGNHTYDHANLTTLTQDQAAAELNGAQAYLVGNGMTRAAQHVAYPYGEFNATVVVAMNQSGVLTGRGTVNHAFTLPTDGWMALPCFVLGYPTSLAQAKAAVDAAVISGSILMFLAHRLVVSPSSDTEWDPDDFAALLSYVIAKDMPTLTVSDLYSLQTTSISGYFGGAALSRTIPLTSGAAENFAMTAGEHIVLQFTTDTPFDEVASAKWVAVARTNGVAAITKTSQVAITGSSVAVATVELLGPDTTGLQGIFDHQLWLYDAAGDGIAAATGLMAIQPSEVP
jgi:peptidoglycan/xylan/chitin deacetylase (PgdA/CDA1 family)